MSRTKQSYFTLTSRIPALEEENGRNVNSPRSSVGSITKTSQKPTSSAYLAEYTETKQRQHPIHT